MLAAVLMMMLAAMALAAPPVEPVLPGGATSEESPPNPASPPLRGGGEATVPSLPVEWQAMSCELHFSKLGFGGVESACNGHHHGHHHHHHHHHQSPEEKRLRCCPVLATWLYAAQIGEDSGAGGGISSSSSSSSSSQVEMPVPPDDSAVCAAQLQLGLHNRGLDFSPLNASCDFSLCFCGIKLRQMASLSCGGGGAALFRQKNASASPLLRRLLSKCADSSHAGCTTCIATLDESMQWTESKQELTPRSKRRGNSERMDCRFMGLMWLLDYNKTRYIPTVSSVVRALLYNADGQCSPDDSNMPLADDTSTTIQLVSSISGTNPSISSAFPLQFIISIVFFYHLMFLCLPG